MTLVGGCGVAVLRGTSLWRRCHSAAAWKHYHNKQRSCLLLKVFPVCTTCPWVLQVLDAFLALHGHEQGGHLFLGATYSMAETSCTSLLQRGVVTLPAYRGIDLWELVETNKLERWVGGGFVERSRSEITRS